MLGIASGGYLIGYLVKGSQGWYQLDGGKSLKVTKQKLNKALIFVKRVLRDFKRNKVIEFEGALFEVDPSRALDVEILKGSFTEVAAVRSLHASAGASGRSRLLARRVATPAGLLTT